MDGEMPRSKSPKMVEIRFSVPETYLREADAVAAYEGRSISSLHRLIWEKGFALHAENVNKVMLNQKLRIELQRYQQTGELTLDSVHDDDDDDDN